MRFQGVVYRAHLPERAFRDPLSGQGAALYGGRFNRIGIPAFYTSLSLAGAAREVSRAGLPMQPVVLCAYEVDSSPILDATALESLAREGIHPPDLDPPDWRRDRDQGRVPACWTVADTLIARGYAGMLVPAFYRGAGRAEKNLVLWTWGDSLPSLVRLVDDEGRLASRAPTAGASRPEAR